MGNDNVKIFEESTSEQITDKYTQMAKERLSETCKSALQTYDLTKLEDAKKQIEDLDKAEVQQGFLNFLKSSINDAYRFITNKEKITRSKSLNEIQEQKTNISEAITTTTHSYKHLNSLLNSLGDNLASKNNEIMQYRTKINKLNTKINSEKNELDQMKDAIPKMKDETYKNALLSIQDETEISLLDLEAEVSYEESNHELCVNDRNLYLLQKSELTETIKSFEYNLNFYKKEMSEIEFLIKKYSTQSYIDTKIQGEVTSFNTYEVKTNLHERESQKIKIYNDATEKQPSLLDLKKQHLQNLKGSARLKR